MIGPFMSRPAILTVDDDAQVLAAIASDLRKKYGKDYRIVRAGSAAEALEALRGLKAAGEPVALLLSAIGIYGVISYSVVQRTHEIGIRAALGASKSNVLGLILRHGLLMAGAGLVLGFLAALALTRILASLLFGVSARDPITIAGVGAILAAVAMLASYVPARRATKIDPLVALTE